MEILRYFGILAICAMIFLTIFVPILTKWLKQDLEVRG